MDTLKRTIFPGPQGPVVLVIMDGVGIGKYPEGDAVRTALKPNFDWLRETAALAGFDGDDAGLRIGLTTAVFDAAALARTAFETIVGLVRGAAQAESAPVPCHLRCGDSTRAPRRERARSA